MNPTIDAGNVSNAPPFSLTKTIRAYHRNEPRRGDEAEPHVSDLFGCLRATWARRAGHDLVPFDDDTLTKFAIGNAIEDAMVKRLGSLGALNLELRRDVVVNLGGLVGHVDYVLEHCDFPEVPERYVVEVKTTTFYPTFDKVTKKRVRSAPSEAQQHYLIQAAAYALALKADWFCVLVICRESGMMAEFWHRAEGFRAEVLRLAGEVMAQTNPAAPMPAAEPPQSIASWACRYCRFVACERNENVTAQAMWNAGMDADQAAQRDAGWEDRP